MNTHTRSLLAIAACAALAACTSGHDTFDKSTQYGPARSCPSRRARCCRA
jgi:hypothetical protein